MFNKTWIICIVFFILTAGLNASVPDKAVMDMFNEAKTLFIKANDLAEQDPEKALEYYKKSALYFEGLYQNQKIKNGKLFYNIANAYYKAGLVGKAILYFKKALIYIPSDPNLLHNLEFVRSKRIDQINEKEQNKILQIIFFFHYKLSSQIKMILFLIFFILFWISASLLLIIKRNYYRWLSIGTLIFSLIFLTSYIMDIANNMFNKTGVITAESVVARKGDSVTYQPTFQEPLHEGTEFKLVEKRRDWYNIELVNGKTCWIEAKYSELVND